MVARRKLDCAPSTDPRPWPFSEEASAQESSARARARSMWTEMLSGSFRKRTAWGSLVLDG